MMAYQEWVRKHSTVDSNVGIGYGGMMGLNPLLTQTSPHGNRG